MSWSPSTLSRVILADSSAWVEHLRNTQRPAHLILRRFLAAGATILTTDVVVMEILAGAVNQTDFARLRSRFRALPCVPADSPEDFDAAATIHRACRAGGETVRSLNDCLIAAVAIRADVPILHSNRDFDVIARHTALQVVPLDQPA